MNSLKKILSAANKIGILIGLIILLALPVKGQEVRFIETEITTNDTYLQPFGLENKVITSLAVESKDYNSSFYTSDYVFAGTESGVFKATASGEEPDWLTFGLEDKEITALTLQHFFSFVMPPDGWNLYAAVKPDYQQGDSTLISRRRIYLPTDTNWTAADNGIDKYVNGAPTRPNRITGLSSYHSGSAPAPVLAGSEYGIYKLSNDIWVQSGLEEGNLRLKIKAIDINPHWQFSLDGVAWAAGYFGLSSAAFRSTNSGVSWTAFPLTGAQDYTAASSVAVNTRNPDSVYVSRDSIIFLTPDNGTTWDYAFSSRGIIINTLAVDPLHPENVFAGGLFFDDSHTTTPHYGIFLHSTNGGKDWNQPTPIIDMLLNEITSIAVLRRPRDSNAYVFIGTKGTGVWRYKYSTVTNITEDKNIPEQFHLYQNYPNPFNPTTEIRYQIPEGSHVSLKLYDVLGREVATLVNEYKHVGAYNYQLLANNFQLSSGIYFYVLNAGGKIFSKKICLIK